MTLPKRCLLVGALLLFCVPNARSVSQDKCTAIAQFSNSNISYDFVPQIIKALAVYQPCDPGDSKCLCHAQTMRKDLEPYVGKGISPEMMAQSKRLGTFYQVIRGRIYRQENCSNPKRCADVDDLLLDIAGDLPDLELVLNVRDWPQVHFLSGLSGPVFSYSTTDSHLDIMYPAWSFWTTTGPILQHYPHGLGRWDWMRQLLAARAAKIPWDAKQAKVFFRGSRSSPERDNLVRLSRRCPNLVDAQYTAGHPIDADPAEEVFLVEHCQYKYLFNFRGVAASFRLRHILLCRSLVLHVGDQWQEFFYSQLKPWVHYVPVASDADVEQLAELVLYLREHDDLAEEIAERGHQFVWLHLRMEDVQCYWSKLLREYAKLLTYKVHLKTGLLEVSNKRAVQLYRG
ncbi:O-glucosyltransferase rumi isoform X1 [Drosophila subpulchrella]|uniref:O-glucosyltransferase rumi isoform X1 n=2 Tax=Drosophila subpulchrella TaxID=1486046 RepID=UPI0018A18ACE|nr:O-glucosyltransferase rumi isoform X1 [Drosophila subpulchrella]